MSRLGHTTKTYGTHGWTKDAYHEPPNHGETHPQRPLTQKSCPRRDSCKRGQQAASTVAALADIPEEEARIDHVVDLLPRHANYEIKPVVYR
jgi:hypothetical protein